jgi:hypothetical protein
MKKLIGLLVVVLLINMSALMVVGQDISTPLKHKNSINGPNEVQKSIENNKATTPVIPIGNFQITGRWYLMDYNNELQSEGFFTASVDLLLLIGILKGKWNTTDNNITGEITGVLSCKLMRGYLYWGFLIGRITSNNGQESKPIFVRWGMNFEGLTAVWNGEKITFMELFKDELFKKRSF